MHIEKRRVFSIGAWSPALRSLLNSTVADCGCVVGVYQAWSGGPLAVVDVPVSTCALGHRSGEEVPAPKPRASAAPFQRA